MGQRLIGEKTELAIRQAELQKATDTKKAEADAADVLNILRMLGALKDGT